METKLSQESQQITRYPKNKTTEIKFSENLTETEQ